MGEKFVGSVDTLLAGIAAVTSGNGSWFEVPAEMSELVVDTLSVTGGPQTVIVESEIGVIHTFTVAGSGVQVAKVSLGGFPGGRRIRTRWILDGGNLLANVTAKETRSGLA